MYINQIKEVIKTAIKKQICDAPLVMVGHAGIGKTQTLRDIATELNIPLSMLRIGSMNDIGDLYGMPYVNKNKETVYGVPEWYKTIQNGGILFIDELNRAKPSLQDAIMQILDMSRFNQFVLPANCFIVGAMNPADENYDVNDFDKAIIDRCVIVPVTQTDNGVLQYLITNNFDPEVIDLVGLSKEHIDFGGTITTPKKSFTPRAIRQLNTWTKVIKELPEEVGDEIVLGCIGAVGFKHWKNQEVLKKIPHAEEYFKQPQKYDISKLDNVAKTIFITRVVSYLKNQKPTEELKQTFTSLVSNLGDQMIAYAYRISQDLHYLNNFIDYWNDKLKVECERILRVALNQGGDKK